MENDKQCPSCKKELIPPNETAILIEFRGEYDGISAFRCPYCEYEWNRFTGKPITYSFTRAQNEFDKPFKQ